MWFALGCAALGCSEDATDTDTGSAGSAGVAASGGTGGSSAPDVTGTTGSGTVECYGTTGSSCTGGQVCCDGFPFADNLCVGLISDCHATPYACDDPSDCPGARCCVTLRQPAGTDPYLGTSCKTECAPPSDVVVCSVDEDCQVGETCSQSAASFRRCM